MYNAILYCTIVVMMYYCYASSTNIILYTGMYITVEGMALFLSGSSLPMVDIVHC
jgi:hypothetical protein